MLILRRARRNRRKRALRAAIIFGMPLIRASIIACEVKCAGFRRPRGLVTEIRVTFLLSGGEAEKVFFATTRRRGRSSAAREHLAGGSARWRVGVQLDRYRSAVRALVSAPSAQARIRLIAASLLRRGSLDAEQIHELAR